MAKTYTSVPNVATGDVLTASAWNTGVAQNINNLRVRPMCRIHRTSAQTLTTSTWTIVSSWTESIDTDDMWTSANDYIEIQTAGVYRVSFMVEFASNSTGNRLATATLNNSAATPGGAERIASCHIVTNNVTSAALSATCMRSFVAGDKIRLHVWQSSGGNLNLTDTTTANGPNPELTAEFVGQVS